VPNRDRQSCGRGFDEEAPAAVGSQTIPRSERSVEATARPVHRPFRTNSLGRVTRHWRVWLISVVASRQTPFAHDKGRGPLLAGHDGCPTGIDKVVAGALTKKRRRRLARKRSHVLNGRLETTVRPVHRPFRTNPLGRVTRHWRVWLISEVASRQTHFAHDKGQRTFTQRGKRPRLRSDKTHAGFF
jgi:hypothetical protein